MRTELVATWPTNDLLPAIRRLLAEADEAVLCVAFANRRGVNLLEPQLAALGGRCRLLVTSVFGGETTGTALAAAADLRARIRILNPPGGTFHPKLYVARGVQGAGAVVGSANLTTVSRNRAVRVGMVAALAAAGMALSPAQAQAVGGSCSSALEKKVVSWNPDVYRVRAWCSSLQADSMAQGVLDRTWSVDAQTPWFTRLYTNYYSDYRTGPISGTYVKIAHL